MPLQDGAGRRRGWRRWPSCGRGLSARRPVTGNGRRRPSRRWRSDAHRCAARHAPARGSGAGSWSCSTTSPNCCRRSATPRGPRWRGGSAHEIKNPLTPIQLSAERLQFKLAPKLDGGRRNSGAVDADHRQPGRGAESAWWTHSASTRGRRSPQLRALDLNALIREVLTLYESLASEHEADLAADLPPVQGDAHAAAPGHSQPAAECDRMRWPVPGAAYRNRDRGPRRSRRVIGHRQRHRFPEHLMKARVRALRDHQDQGTGLGLRSYEDRRGASRRSHDQPTWRPRAHACRSCCLRPAAPATRSASNLKRLDHATDPGSRRRSRHPRAAVGDPVRRRLRRAAGGERGGGARVPAASRPDLVLLDIWMPDTDGITLLKEWASSGQLTMPVVMMSGHGTIDTAVEATRIGAYDFLEKPIALQKLLATVARRSRPPRPRSPGACRWPRWARATSCATSSGASSRYSRPAVPVLVLGEPGTGHDAAARALAVPGAPFVALASGARLAANPMALLEEARDGTLFCAEIGLYSKSEQKGLAFLLPKLERASVTLVATSAEPLGQPCSRGQVRPGAAGGALRRRRRAAAAALAPRGHPGAGRAVLAGHRGDAEERAAGGRPVDGHPHARSRSA